MATVIVEKGAAARPPSPLSALLLGKRAERMVLGAAFLVALFALWELVAALGLEPPIVLPSPAAVAVALGSVFSSPDLVANFVASGQELLYGLVLAVAVGVIAGMAIGWYPRLGYFFDPFVNFLYAVPRVALGPLLIVWLGIGLSSKVALVFLTAVFPVLVNTSSGIRSLDSHLVRVARCFGANDLKIFRTIALPGSVPFILGGLRLAVGQALIGVFVAELLGAQHGLGAMIQNAGEQFQTDLVFAGLLIFAAVGMLLTSLVRWLERRFDAWRV
ncbi:MAG TPA: ABC transporter permease [Beijerinckiaceae bacterium]|nr:ABC transporter permease [Beijerinckiaceae bacterium]